MKTGKTRQGLLEALREMNGFTQVDSAYLPGQQLTLKATKTNGAFKQWYVNDKRLRDQTFDTPEEAIAVAMGKRVVRVCGKKVAGKIVWNMSSEGAHISSNEFDSIDEAVEHLTADADFSLTINCHREISDDFAWEIKESSSALRSYEPFATGKGMNTLKSAIQDMDKTATVKDTLVVLCLTSSESSKTWNGLYQTTWVLLDPACPFIINKKGFPEFETINLNLKQSEYKLCIDTQLAFYDTSSKSLYPIPSKMLSPLSRVMSCGGSFTEKAMNGTPLGQAHILANNLLSMEGVQLFYRERTDKVKPLIGICGQNFCAYSQVEFFEKMLKICADNGFGTIEKWTVSDDSTTVNVGITQSTAAYKPCINLRISDLPVNPASIKAYAKIGTAQIAIFSNSAKQSNVLKKKGLESLFIDETKTVNTDIPWTLFDEFNVFSGKFQELEKTDIYLHEYCLSDEWVTGDGILVPILKNMGSKRRIEAIKRLQSNIRSDETYNAAILFCSVVELVFCELPPIQAWKQEILFAELLEEFLLMVRK